MTKIASASEELLGKLIPLSTKSNLFSRPRLPFMAKLAMGWSNPDDEIQDLIQESVEQNWEHQ